MHTIYTALSLCTLVLREKQLKRSQSFMPTSYVDESKL